MVFTWGIYLNKLSSFALKTKNSIEQFFGSKLSERNSKKGMYFSILIFFYFLFWLIISLSFYVIMLIIFFMPLLISLPIVDLFLFNKMAISLIEKPYP